MAMSDAEVTNITNLVSASTYTMDNVRADIAKSEYGKDVRRAVYAESLLTEKVINDGIDTIAIYTAAATNSATRAANSAASIRHDNYLSWPYENMSGSTTYGVTYTINDDGSVHCSGTPTELSSFYILSGITLPVGTYTLSGGKSSAISFRADNQATGKNYISTGSAVTFSVVSGDVWNFRVRLSTSAGTVSTDVYPMLSKGSTAYDYSSPALSNVSLRNNVDENTTAVSELKSDLAVCLYIDADGYICLKEA